MRNRKSAAILTLLIVSLVLGCAGTPTQMQPEDIEGVRRLAIVTALSEEELTVLDRTGVMEKSYGGMQFGAIGALLESVILLAEQDAAIKASLGGEPDALREEMRDFPAKKIFDDNLTEMLSLDCEVIYPRQVDSLGIGGFSKREAYGGETIRDYSALREKLGAETILEIKFVYGLAAYAEEESSVAVSADVSVIDVEKHRLLMRKNISSDTYYKNGHTVDEFEADGAKLFRTEIVKAMRVVAHFVAAEFGRAPGYDSAVPAAAGSS